MPPPARSLRSRPGNPENDENAGSTRLTRAKAAALTDAGADVSKKPAQSKKPTTGLAGHGPAATKKRPALGDVSNTAQTDVGLAKDAKKATAKAGLIAKAGQPTKVQKSSRSTTRSTLLPRDKAAADLKRPASESGPTGNAAKKRNTHATKTIQEQVETGPENVPETTATAVAVEVQVEKNTAATSEQAKEINIYEDADAQHVGEIVDEIADLDREDLDDPFMVSEYVGDIFIYMRELELATMPNPDYMDNQDELEWKMRGILVDWLLEVHTRFRLLPETLFLAVNVVDRFLSLKMVQLDRLQLVGVTALFIASKYEEVLSPHVQNFRHVAEDGFTDEEILNAERFLLSALNYDLSYPNPMNFLRRISKADRYDIQTRTIGKYLLEISCLDHRFLHHPPSQVAAASMFLARRVFAKGEWDADLIKYSGYSEEDIQPVVDLMIDYLSSPVVHDAFFRKYASKKFMKASIILRRWAKEYVAEYGNPMHDAAAIDSYKSDVRVKGGR